MRKQMEGDNQRRRALARQARERGRQASETGASLSASKQLTHLDTGRRSGPLPAGSRHKADSTRGGPAPPPAGVPERPRPRTAPEPAAPGITAMGYRELVDEIGRRAGVDFRTAKVGAEATVLALAWALGEADRQRLLTAVPSSLHDVVPVDGIERHADLPGFLTEVSRMSGRSPEQARRQAEATLATLAARDADLVESLHVPDGLRELLEPGDVGGGVVGASTVTAPLTQAQLRAALADLPYWSGDGRSLTRTVELPADNLDRVLDRVEQVREDIGRSPRIGRPDPGTAVLTVFSGAADAITAPDVELAHAVDAAIDEAGAGMTG
ncbi:Pterin-4a-carbinolamine dehydratase [Micromonospora nigra]|uniref:Putative pterin-4-alpha-carbinolamine dehydratase n=1 Tax=Micromonospora nigra TaxID=145857 RepID=A0A1C6T1H8_9ACTN|nr:4a-hydroxytetrahydrobiopterin dehydratase [Micromonospora nigra]SCL35591.1 Pterin-4a-carbinolamine dehydratase [Micromonospora nigra]